MSQFKGFTSALLPNGTTTASMQSTFSSLLTSYGWQIQRQGIVPTSIVGTFTNSSNAFDMVPTTSATTSSLPAYIGCNIAAGFVPVKMYVQADYGLTVTTAPLTFTLDYSSNGSSWTTLGSSYSGNSSWLPGEVRVFTISGASSQTWWRINVTAANSGSSCSINSFILEDASGNWLVGSNFFDCIPPTTETIGNSTARDVLRWAFPTAGTSIVLRSIQELLVPLPQCVVVYGATAGAVTCSVTINSNTVSYAGSSGDTALQNLRGLYEALRTSSNSNFTAWNWLWFPSILTTNGTGIIAISKVPSANITPTSSNVLIGLRGSYVSPRIQFSQFTIPNSITIDLINGFIYYLQVNSRGLALGIKTNANFYTPIHACYADNSAVLSQLPLGDLDSYGLPCTPIELYVGIDNAVSQLDGIANISHFWGVAGSGMNATINTVSADYNAYTVCPNFSHCFIPGILMDYAQNVTSTSACTYQSSQMYSEGFFSAADYAGTLWNIHKLGSVSATYAGFLSQVSGNVQGKVFNPSYIGLDWYKFTGTAPTNEQLLISPCIDFTTTITATTTSSDTTITVADTTNFPTSGWIFIDGELISYTGKTSTTFTGCSRGMYATKTITPILGTTVYICAWFVFMVSGLLFAGYQTPS